MKEGDGQSISPASPGRRTRLKTLSAQAPLHELYRPESEEGGSPKGIDLAEELESYEKELIRSALMQTAANNAEPPGF